MVFITIFCSIALFTSCAVFEPYSEGDGKVRVVCTVFAPFDFARVIGGDRVTVTLLQDSGSDMHSYTPTSATLDTIGNADLFIYIGGISDATWVDRTVSASENSELSTLSLMDLVTPIFPELECDPNSHSHEYEDHDGGKHSSDLPHEHSHKGHDHGADEHVWTSLLNSIAIVEAIRDELCRIDPDGAGLYTANAESYVNELAELHQQYSECLSSAKEIMVFADRFPFTYLAHDYGIAYKAAFSGCSSETNAGFEMQVGLIRAVREHGLSFVLTTEGDDKPLAEAIAAETGCLIVKLDSLQSVDRSDIENGISYLAVMKSNLSALLEVIE